MSWVKWFTFSLDHIKVGGYRIIKISSCPIDCSIRVMTVILEYFEHILAMPFKVGGALAPVHLLLPLITIFKIQITSQVILYRPPRIRGSTGSVSMLIIIIIIIRSLPSLTICISL